MAMVMERREMEILLGYMNFVSSLLINGLLYIFVVSCVGVFTVHIISFGDELLNIIYYYSSSL